MELAARVAPRTPGVSGELRETRQGRQHRREVARLPAVRHRQGDRGTLRSEGTVMNTRHMKRVLQLAPAIVAAALLLGASRQAEAGCFQNLAHCYQEAAKMDGWGWMWLAGLDCELDFTDCTRRSIIGR